MRRIFKKGLSVFLSLLMVFTSLVFVVPEFKASAVNSGKYYVKVTYYCDDKYDGGNEYTGPSFTGEGAGFTVYYKTNNGTGTETYSTSTVVSVTEDCKSNFDSKSVTVECNGFPSKVAYYNRGGTIFSRTYGISKVEVSSSSTGSFSVLWEGSVGADAASTQWKAEISSSGAKAINTGTGGWYAMTDTTKSWNYPYADEINWIDADTSAQTIEKTANVSKTFKYNIVDQYGVVLSDTALTNLNAKPSVTISGSKSGTIGTTGDIYHTYTNGTSNYQEVITAKPSAQGETWDSQNITIKVTADSLSSSKTYTLNDNTYTYTLDANEGSFATDDVTSQTKSYYNTYGNLPTPTKEGYKFRGFYTTQDNDFTDDLPAEGDKLTISTPMASDTTWYASWKINSYGATFKYMTENGEVTSDKITADYNSTFELPEFDKKVVYNDVEYTFTGWSPTLDYNEVDNTAVMPAITQIYEAQYGKVTLYADYTKVTDAIDAANKVMADPEYEARYTDSSREAVTSAIAAVKYNLGLSKQPDVDGYADAINNAVDKLEENKYVVLFLDDDGTIIKDGYHFVEYGDTVAVPATPEKDYDADKHYTFDKWDEDTSACSYVTDDLVFTAQFIGTNHTYSTSTVESTCTTDGSTLYECIGCDHSYTVANGDTAGHTWETTKRTIIDATCGTAGLKATYCSVCGAIDKNSFETYTEESEHSWGKEVELVHKEKCNETGVYTKTCTVCNKTEYRFEYPTDHTWEDRPTVIAPTCSSVGYTITRCTTCWFASLSQQQAINDNHTLVKTTLDPTCTKPGYEKEECYYCNYEKTITIPVIDHNVPDEWTTEKEATCGTDGILHRECTMCKGEDEYDSIPATGNHAWGEWAEVNAAKCGTMGLEKRKCQNCDAEETQAIEALEHSWVAYPANTKAPTCEATGFDAIICEHCGDTGGTLTSKLGHDYEKTAETQATCEAAPTETWTCKNDATHTYTIITGVPNEHNYGTGTVVTQATCTTPQISLYICADCGDRYELATAVPNGHSYIDNWQVISAATATENGQLVRRCTVCNAAPEYATIPATGAHSFVKGEYVAPDCDTAGSQAWVCTTHDDCEANYEETIPATGHQLVFDKKDASCTETGYVKLVCSVDDCGAELDSYVVPMLCHTYTEVAGSRQEASCTEPGSYKTACACGAEQTIAIPAKGHSYTTEDIPANCTIGAKTVYSCACGDTYTITTSDPLGHDWTDWSETKAATATTAGELTRTCNNGCGAKETAPLAPTGEHNFVKDTDASVEATCDTAGKLVFKCTAEHNCGVTFTHNVEAKGHQFGLDYKKATCTEDGHSILYCTVCGHIAENNVIDKLGHKYEAEVTTEAKCGEEGEITYTCANCGDSYTKKVPALEHSFIVEVAGTKVAPTCITDGKVTMKCYYCDATQEKVLGKTGHMFDEGTVLVKPDCVTAGKIEYTCQYDHTHKFTEVIEPTGSHTLVGEIVEYPATCIRPARNEQYCEACKNWVVVWESDVPASHTWNDWVVEKLPTQTEDGYQYRVCSVCGEIEEMILTAGRMFRVTFYNDNGERLTRPAEYTYGSKVERPEDPIKHETDVHTFEFLGWTYGGYEYENVEAEVAETKAMLDYLGYGFDFSKKPGDEGYETQEGYVKELALVAVYKKVEKTYKVTYIDGNGDEKIVENVKHSDITTAYNGVPVKDQTEVYTYTFREWQIVCSKDKMTGEYVATATAQFDKHVIPGQEDKVEKEPSILMNFINSIINFFKNILAKIGIKL